MKFYSSVYAPDETNLSLQAIVPNPMGGFTMLGVIGRHGNTEYFKNAEVFGLDSDGNVLWRRAYGDESDEWPISLVLLPNGHFLVGISKDEEHTYLLELDGTGEPVDEWLSPDSLGKQMSCELLPTSDGGLLVGTGQDNRDPKAPYGEYNELIYKLDASRQVLWSYRFEEQRPTPDQYTVDMVEALDGSGYVGCNYGEQFSNTVDQYADVLGSVWKLSPTGELMWRRAYRVIETNNSKHSFDDLAATPDGGYILCGYSQENYTETAEMPLGQGWLLKLDEHGCLVPGCHEPTAVNVPEAAPTGLRLHPNPVQAGGQLAVQVVGTGGAGVFRIFDALGREWLAAHVVGPDGTTYLLPTEELPAGTYFLTYENRAGAVASARFVLLGG